jgi:hypothetical protein
MGTASPGRHDALDGVHDLSKSALTEPLHALAPLGSPRQSGSHRLLARDPRGPHGRRLRRAARPRVSRVPGLGPSAKPAGTPRQLGDRSDDREASTPSAIVMAEADPDKPSALNHDRRAFQLKERMTSSDMREPRAAAQPTNASAGRSSRTRSGRQAARSLGARSRPLSYRAWRRGRHALANRSCSRRNSRPPATMPATLDAREGDERERRPRVNSDDARSTVASPSTTAPRT